MANDCYTILLQHNYQASIGITTGQALCGTVGSTSRTEYAVVGSVVNLAAKLMAGNKEGGILMDTQTKRALVLNDRLASQSSGRGINKVGGSSALYAAGPAMVVKGLSEPVETFRLLPPTKRVVGASSLTKGEGESIINASDGVLGTRGQLLGREREITLLSAAVARFLEDPVKGSQWGKAHSIFLSGPAGIGKTMVANKGTAILQAANSTLLISHCQASSKNQPCAALNSVLDELICWTPHTTSDGTFESDEERHDRERGIVRALATEISALPSSVYTALKFVLGINWSINDTRNEDNASSKLQVMEPIEVVGNILSTKLAKRIALDDSKGAKVVLVIEDVHWIDSSSLGVLQQLCHENLPLLLFCTSRPSSSLDQVRVLPTVAVHQSGGLLDRRVLFIMIGMSVVMTRHDINLYSCTWLV